MKPNAYTMHTSTTPIAATFKTNQPNAVPAKSTTSIDPLSSTNPYLFERAILNRATAAIIHNVGFESVSESCINVLSSMMENYLQVLCRTSTNYAHHANRTRICLSDVSRSFEDNGMSLTELHDYIREVDSFSTQLEVPLFPISECRIPNMEEIQADTYSNKKENTETIMPSEKVATSQQTRSFPNFYQQSAQLLGFNYMDLPEHLKILQNERSNFFSETLPETSLHMVKEENKSIHHLDIGNLCTSPQAIKTTSSTEENNFSNDKQKFKKKKKDKHKKHDKKKKRKSKDDISNDVNCTSQFYTNEKIQYEKTIHMGESSCTIIRNDLDNKANIITSTVESADFAEESFKPSTSKRELDCIKLNAIDFDHTIETVSTNESYSKYSENEEHVMESITTSSLKLNKINDTMPTLDIQPIPKLKLHSVDQSCICGETSRKEKKKKSKKDKKNKEHRRLEKTERKRHVQSEHNEIMEDSVLNQTDELLRSATEHKVPKLKIIFGHTKAEQLKIQINTNDVIHDKNTDNGNNRTMFSTSPVISPMEISIPGAQHLSQPLRPLKIFVGKAKNGIAPQNGMKLPKYPRKKKSTKFMELREESHENGEEEYSRVEYSSKHLSPPPELSVMPTAPISDYMEKCFPETEILTSAPLINQMDDTVYSLPFLTNEKEITNNELLENEFRIDTSTPYVTECDEKINEPPYLSSVKTIKSQTNKSPKKSKLSTMSESTGKIFKGEEKSCQIVTTKTMTSKCSKAETLLDDCFSNSTNKMINSETVKHVSKEETPNDFSFSSHEAISEKKPSKVSNLNVTLLGSSISKAKPDDKKDITKVVKTIMPKKEKTKVRMLFKPSSGNVKKITKQKSVEKSRTVVALLSPTTSKRKKSDNSLKTTTTIKVETAPTNEKQKKIAENVDILCSTSSMPTSKNATENNEKCDSAPTGVLSTEDDENIWICPMCSVAYVDGAADMVGCDDCDRWFHWHCVGLLIAPPENKKWFCPTCAKKRKKGATAAATNGEATSKFSKCSRKKKL